MHALAAFAQKLDAALQELKYHAGLSTMQGPPFPAVRQMTHGIQGGVFPVDQPTAAPKGAWKPILRLESKRPDRPWEEQNDHYRTVYVHAVTPGPQTYTEEGEGGAVIRIGLAIRLTFGVGNGRMIVIYNVPPSGIVHAAFVGESVEVEAAYVQIAWDDATVADALTQPLIDNPPTYAPDAEEAPTVLVGIIQNQSLAMSAISTPKRMVTMAIQPAEGGGTSILVPVPRGARSVTVLGDPNLIVRQIYNEHGTGGVDSGPVGEEQALVPGAWEIELDPVDIAAADPLFYATVIFGLGI